MTMKSYIIRFLILTVLGSGTIILNVEAQSDKKAKLKEYKEWKKKLKKMDPLDLKALYESNSKYKESAAELNTKNAALSSQLREVNSIIESKNQEINQIKKSSNTISRSTNTQQEDYTKGITYRVQLGAFKNKDLSRFHNRGSFWSEDEDGTKKYTIANFRDYSEARTFKDYLNEIGLKGAWVVAYENDQRRDIKEILSR